MINGQPRPHSFVRETVGEGRGKRRGRRGSQSCAAPHENWRRNIQAIRYTSITFNRTLRFPAAKEMEKSSVPYNLFHQNQPPCQPAKSPRKTLSPFPPSLCHFSPSLPPSWRPRRLPSNPNAPRGRGEG